jgi:hypothetical protein
LNHPTVGRAKPSQKQQGKDADNANQSLHPCRQPPRSASHWLHFVIAAQQAVHTSDFGYTANKLMLWASAHS